MPLPRYLRRTIYTLTIMGWLVVVLAATPFGTAVTDDQRALAVLVAAVGSLKWLARRMLLPAHELFTVGKLIGRAEAIAEQDSDVVRLDERRTLRAVGGGRSVSSD